MQTDGWRFRPSVCVQIERRPGVQKPRPERHEGGVLLLCSLSSSCSDVIMVNWILGHPGSTPLPGCTSIIHPPAGGAAGGGLWAGHSWPDLSLSGVSLASTCGGVYGCRLHHSGVEAQSWTPTPPHMKVDRLPPPRRLIFWTRPLNGAAVVCS